MYRGGWGRVFVLFMTSALVVSKQLYSSFGDDIQLLTCALKLFVCPLHTGDKLLRGTIVNRTYGIHNNLYT